MSDLSPFGVRIKELDDVPEHEVFMRLSHMSAIFADGIRSQGLSKLTTFIFGSEPFSNLTPTGMEKESWSR